MSDPENNRQMQHLLLDGQVSAVDYQNWQCKIKSDKIETDWMPMPTQRAGKAHIWSPLEVGEQVTFACLNGDPNHGRIVASFFTDGMTPKAAKAGYFHINFENGDYLTHDDEGNFTIETTKTFKIKARDIELEAENSFSVKSQIITSESDTQNHAAQTITMETPILNVTGSIVAGGGSTKFRMPRMGYTAQFNYPTFIQSTLTVQNHLQVNSTITAQSNITSNHDVLVNDETGIVKLKEHKHGGIMVGGADTKEPNTE